MEKSKTVQILITLTSQHLSKLVQDNNSMNAWLLGEEIARRLKQNPSTSIALNLGDIFTKYNV